MKKPLALFIGMLCILSACNQTKYNPEIQKIDSTLTRIDSADKRLSAIDTSGIYKSSLDFSEKFRYIQSYFKAKNDTIGSELASDFSDFQKLNRAYSDFILTYSTTVKELEFSESQLEDLQHDLKHNLLQDEYVSKLLKTEVEAAENAMNTVDTLAGMKLRQAEKMRMLRPKLDSIYTEIKKD